MLLATEIEKVCIPNAIVRVNDKGEFFTSVLNVNAMPNEIKHKSTTPSPTVIRMSIKRKSMLKCLKCLNRRSFDQIHLGLSQYWLSLKN